MNQLGLKSGKFVGYEYLFFSREQYYSNPNGKFIQLLLCKIEHDFGQTGQDQIQYNIQVGWLDISLPI